MSQYLVADASLSEKGGPSYGDCNDFLQVLQILSHTHSCTGQHSQLNIFGFISFFLLKFEMFKVYTQKRENNRIDATPHPLVLSSLKVL